MTGPEHYAAAERLLRILTKPVEHGGTVIDASMNPNVAAAAQAHATLALAAATALGHCTPEDTFPDADRRAWYVAASEGPGEKQRQREAKAAELAELAEFAAEDQELAQATGTEKS